MNYLNKKGLILSLLALSLGVSGCTNSKNSTFVNPVPAASTSTSVADTNQNKSNFIKRTSEDLTSWQLQLSTDEYQSILDTIKSINTKFDFIDLYNTGMYNLDITSLRNSAIGSNEDKTLKFDSASLKQIVLQNNQSYLEQLGANKAFYHEIDNNVLNKIIDLIIETVNLAIAKDHFINVTDINNTLSNLKILEKNSGNNAAVSEDEVLTVNQKMINCMQQINSSEKDVFRAVITHEIMHLIEKNPYNLQKESGIKITGISTNYHYDKTVLAKDREVCPLNWTWFSEAAAETKMTSFTGNNEMVYDYMIGYLNSLKLATMFSPTISKSFEDINLEKNLNAFLIKFNIKNFDDRNEIFNMMYSLEIIEKEPEEFFRKYEEVYGFNPKNKQEDLKALKDNLKNSICTTITKYFYQMLANRISSSSVSLADIFYMINIFESDLNLHTSYASSENTDNYQYLLETYNTIQSKFFEVISAHLNLDYNQLVTMFEEYGIQTIEGNNNYTETFLALDQRKFIDYKWEDYKKYAAENIISLSTVDKTYTYAQ